MKRNTIQLLGCHPRPLSSYLKGLAILRLVHHQADASATAWWRGETFYLASQLDEKQLVDFFLSTYQPTPLIAPWNGGSGFYPKDKKDGIDAIANSTCKRLAVYREAIGLGQALIGNRDSSPKKDEKDKMLRHASATWRGPLADWLHAALSIHHDGSPAYPALLGTGGNDGRLDFTNNFMQRLTEVFDVTGDALVPMSYTACFLRQSIFGKTTRQLEKLIIGQFNPGAAGGANSGNGFNTTARVNPFDFLLMLEGTLAFNPAIVRKNHPESLPQAAAPFAVTTGPAGYATAVAEEKSRGEQWMPLWNQPTSFSELRHVFSEARCRVGKHVATQPRDVAQAIARCGIARGIDRFQRYGYLERNGQANLAASLGRWNVSDPSEHAMLLAEINPWLDRLTSAARGKTAPGSWQSLVRQINDSIMECCRGTATSTDWVRLLMALGRAEQTLLRSPQATAGAYLSPLYAGSSGLSPGWLKAAADHTAETRLAVSLAAQTGPYQRSHQRRPSTNLYDPIRRHFVPLNQQDKRVFQPHRFASSSDSLHQLNEVVVVNLDPVADLIAIVHRRLIQPSQGTDQRHMPIVPRYGFEATPSDLRGFIEGRLDDNKIMVLARAFMAIDWSAANESFRDIAETLGYRKPWKSEPRKKGKGRSPEAAMHYGWAVIRLCFHWDTMRLLSPNNDSNHPSAKAEFSVPLDKKIFTSLVGGNPGTAMLHATHRLRASGLPVRSERTLVDSATARRWAASLAWSVSDPSIEWLSHNVVHETAVDWKKEDLTEHEQPSS